MWVIELDDGSEPRALSPNRTYTVGRGMDNDFLLSKPSISKNHLEIRIGLPIFDDISLDPTPITIYTESKATTEVNGVAHKASPEKPKVIEVSSSEVTIRLGSLKREHCTLKLLWDSFFINFDNDGLYGDACTVATKIDARPRRYSVGALDGGFVCGGSYVCFGEVHALVEGVPVMSCDEWMKSDVDEVRKRYRNRQKLTLFEGETVCTDLQDGKMILQFVGVNVRPINEAREGDIMLGDRESARRLADAILAGNLDPLRYHQPKIIEGITDQPKRSSQRKRRKVTLDDTLNLMFGGGADNILIPSSPLKAQPETQVPETVGDEISGVNETPEISEVALESEEKVYSTDEAVNSIDSAPKKKHNIAEAIILSKQIKRETQQMDSLETDSPEVPVSVTIESANLLRKTPPSSQVRASSGCKNFKRFRKTGSRECDGSRVFLNLVQYDVSANSIRKEDEDFLSGFADSFNQVIPELDRVMEPQRPLHSKRNTVSRSMVSKRIKTNQLFVSDADFEAPEPAITVDDEEDTAPKFRFSRR